MARCTDAFDICAACQEWSAAKHRRRGGQPVFCRCGRPMRRINFTAWGRLLGVGE